MQIFHKIENLVQDSIFQQCPGTRLAMGNFDGVHLGHQSILNHAVQQASLDSLKSLCITFFPHPAQILNPSRPFPLIQTLDQRIAAIQKIGFDFLFIQPFSLSFSQIPYQAFFRKTLLQDCKMTHLHVGQRFCFGHQRQGTLERVRELCQENQIHFFPGDIVEKNGQPISSSVIRTALHKGDISMANSFLGRPYEILGTVVQGLQQGQKLGFPTANLETKIPPLLRRGVYRGKFHVQGQVFDSIANFGLRPSVKGHSKEIPQLEVHVPEKEMNLYGEEVRFEVLNFLREERTFDSLEALKEQINQDIQSFKDDLLA